MHPPSPPPVPDHHAPVVIANEFAEVTVCRVETRNGVRLEICSTRQGRTVRMDALELEALTWQEPAFFSALLDEPFGPVPLDGPPRPDRSPHPAGGPPRTAGGPG